jgi:hypothetical protein
MARGNKRKNPPPAGREGDAPDKRQRKPTTRFEQGVNPALPTAPPPTPPPTVRRPATQPQLLSPQLPPPSPLFEPEATQASQSAALEDEDDDTGVDTGDDQELERQVDTVTPASRLQTTPQATLVDEEPHIHVRWRACWGSMDKNPIPSAARFARNKPVYAITSEKIWRWADEVIQSQLPRIAQLSSLTATLYYNMSRLAKADRCSIALQRRCIVAGQPVVLGNWAELLQQVEEMDKESDLLLNCDFDLVLREQEQAALLALQPPSSTPRGSARRPGIVTAIQEEGLASIVTAEVFATGNAIRIRDRWRCQEESCSNNPMVCWVRRLPGRQIDRREEHYAVNGNLISSWAAAIARGECTVEEPTDDIRLAIIMSRDRADNARRRRRRVSPTSSNSSIEGLAKAILAGHLAQMRTTQPCNHSYQLPDAAEPTRHRRWIDFECTRLELHQHTYNFFRYWSHAMPQLKKEISHIKTNIFERGHYDINMLMDGETGMTLEVWVNYYKRLPGLLSHLRRKAHDWIKDYGGLAQANFDAMTRQYSNAAEVVGDTQLAEQVEQAGEQRDHHILLEVSGNLLLPNPLDPRK